MQVKRGRPAIYQHPQRGNVESRPARVPGAFTDEFLRDLWAFCAERAMLTKPMTMTRLIKWVKLSAEPQTPDLDVNISKSSGLAVTREQIESANMRSLGWIAWVCGVRETASEIKGHDRESVQLAVLEKLGL